MLFNYDSFELVAIAFIVSGMFVQAYYFSRSAIMPNNESLVNTISPLDPVNTVISENTTPIPVPDPTPLPILGPNNPNYVDVGIQTDVPGSYWGTIKQWFLDVFSVRSSEFSSIGINKVENWKTNLDLIQSVDLHNSESSLSTQNINKNLDNLVDPNDSASNISEVISNVSAVGTNDVVNYYYIELFGNIVETITSEALIQAANVGFIGFC
jgi:hypothetical protein